MPFQPGQSGNPLGTKTEKMFQSALKRAIARSEPELLEKIAQKLLSLASAGEYWAVQMLADRLDGKPKQQIEAIDEEGRSVAVALITYSPAAPIRTETLPAPDTESTGLRH